jgi:hypothetical protein
MRNFGTIAICGVLFGCASAGTGQDASVPPDYLQTLIRNKSTLFKDPESVRDVMMSDPKPNMWGWGACLKANAKNVFGGYTGQTVYKVQLYRNGNPPIIQSPTIYDGCGSELYEPFPELEGNYVPPAKPAAPAGVSKPTAAIKPRT